MDYVSMFLQEEKKNRGPFGHLSGSNEIGGNPGFRARMEAAQQLMAQEADETPVKEKAKKCKPDDAPVKKRAKKEKIPATLKNIVWHKYFETSLTGLCQCCKVENISKAIFDAGHIISEANGGKVVLDNLKPICKLCNSSMGKTNMDEFMKKYGI